MKPKKKVNRLRIYIIKKEVRARSLAEALLNEKRAEVFSIEETIDQIPPEPKKDCVGFTG